MVAQLVPERDFCTPGCDERCEVLKVQVPGQFGRSELLLHSAEAHEQYGRQIGVLEGDGGERVDVVITGPLVISVRRFVAALDGVLIDLTATELRVLISIARRGGSVVSAETIISEAWRGAFGYTAHGVRVHVSRIRRKLGRAASLLTTVPSAGYRLEMLEEGAALAAYAPKNHPRRLNGRWARAWDACRVCGRNDRPHNGRGLCTACQRQAPHADGPS